MASFLAHRSPWARVLEDEDLDAFLVQMMQHVVDDVLFLVGPHEGDGLHHAFTPPPPPASTTGFLVEPTRATTLVCDLKRTASRWSRLRAIRPLCGSNRAASTAVIVTVCDESTQSMIAAVTLQVSAVAAPVCACFRLPTSSKCRSHLSSHQGPTLCQQWSFCAVPEPLTTPVRTVRWVVTTWGPPEAVPQFAAFRFQIFGATCTTERSHCSGCTPKRGGGAAREAGYTPRLGIGTLGACRTHYNRSTCGTGRSSRPRCPRASGLLRWDPWDP